MKKFKLITLLLFTFFISLLNAQTRLISYSVDNFGEISRVKINFSQQASYSYRKESNNKRIVISIPNAKNDAPSYKAYNLPTVTDISIKSAANQLNIIIKTANIIAEVKEYPETGKNFSLIYHIYNTSSPTTFNELYSFAKYQKFLGNKDKFLNYYNKAKALDPNNPKLNELSKNTQIKDENNKKTVEPKKTQIKKEVPKTKNNKKADLKKKTEKKKEKPVEIKKEKPVEPKKEKTPVVTPPVEQPKETPKPEIKNEEKTETPETKTEESTPTPVNPQKYIMRNQMRIPVTRPDLITKKAPAQQVVAPVPTPEKNTEPLKKEEPAKEEPKPESSALPLESPVTTTPEIQTNNQNEKFLLELFKSIDADSSRQTLVLGVVSSYIGANKEAINYLKSVPKDSPLKNDANKYLYDVYIKMGKDYASDAKLLYAEMNPDTSATAKNAGLFDMNIKLWMGLAFGALILVLTIIIMTIINHAKKVKKAPKVSESDFEIHKKHLERAYQNKLENETETTTEPETIIPDYDNPPVISESLNKEEEKELEEDEDANFITIMTKDSKKNEDFDDDDTEGFADEEYKKKMILKLFNDGWAIEEIAKELQISQREIEFIIKMSE
jgi:hypothetical protein